MGGDNGLFLRQPWSEVCATVSATLDASGRFNAANDPKRAAATVGRSLARLSHAPSDEEELMRAVLSDSEPDQGFAAFRAVYTALAEAVARVAEADVVLSRHRHVVDVEGCWPALRDDLVRLIEEAAFQLNRGQASAAAAHMVRGGAEAALTRAAAAGGGTCYRRDRAYGSFVGHRMNRNYAAHQLLQMMSRLREHAARVADLLLPPPPDAAA